ncbi:MAG: hypothetical protein J6W31_05865 [Clostridia bacterium]|nr:hypothetical protein [Clostridia bacterium]
MGRYYCYSFVCGAKDCTFECVGCEFQYDCEFCGNQDCEHHGKSEDEIDWEEDANGGKGKMMARYIDADALEKDLISRGFYPAIVKRAIEDAPTADVVEVVRCKDCSHYIEMEGFDFNGRKARSCVWHSALRHENDYCSDGMRRK